jgi:hypothetical protein
MESNKPIPQASTTGVETPMKDGKVLSENGSRWGQTPVDAIYEIKMIRRKNPIDIEAFFSFSLFENNPLREKISVAEIVRKRTILASSIIGVTKL